MARPSIDQALECLGLSRAESTECVSASVCWKLCSSPIELYSHAQEKDMEKTILSGVTCNTTNLEITSKIIEINTLEESLVIKMNEMLLIKTILMNFSKAE